MQWKIYKRGQGYYTRLGTAIGVTVLSALGCMSLYRWLGGLSIWDKYGFAVQRWIQAGVPAVLFLVLGWLTYKVLNTPKYADFLIATEGEIKKVSWSSRKEVVASTKVVIVTVIILAMILAVVDYTFTGLFRVMGVLQF